MAEKNRNELKTYFEAGDRPTENNFIDLIDSFVSRLEDDFIETLPDATTTQKGIVEQATLTEVESGTDTTRFVTPKGVKRAVETFSPVKSINGQTGDVVLGLGVDDSEWQIPSLLNGIVNYSTSYQGARYRKKDGVVYIEGIVKGGTATGTVTIFTLPPGFRPNKRIIVSGMKSGNIPVRIDIATSGIIYCYGYSTVMTSLSGISFLVD